MSEVETKNEESTKRTIKDYAIAKRSKLIFFVLNLALVVPFLVQNYSHWGLGGAFAVLLLAFYFLIIKPNETTPATKDIPLLLFFNVLFYLVVSYQSLIDNFKLDNLGYVFENTKSECVMLFLGGLAASLFLPKTPNLLWLRSVAKTAMGAAIVMQIWSNGKIFDPEFYAGGETMIAFYLLFAVFWFTFCIISSYVDESAYKRNNWLTNFLIIFLVLFCTTENNIAQIFTHQANQFLLQMPSDGLAWWKVILSAVVLVGCAIAVFDYLNDTMGADALILSFVASALIVLRVLIANYFSFNWILFFVFLVSSIRCLKNELRQAKTLRLSTLAYAVIQFCVALVSIWLIKAGLWINLLIAGIYTLIFYTTVKNRTNEKHKLRHWLTILSVPAMYAIALVWQLRFSLDAIVLIALAYAVFAGVMVILHWPHPDNLAVPRGYKVIICAMLILLCWISASRYGADVNVTFDTEKQTVAVEIEANGKNNQIQSVEYQWSSIIGESAESTATMSKNGASIPIQGEILTITVTDTHGVVTTKTEWYPNWLLPK